MVDGVVLSNKPDSWIWSMEDSGLFSVASATRYIDDIFCAWESDPTKGECGACKSSVLLIMGRSNLRFISKEWNMKIAKNEGVKRVGRRPDLPTNTNPKLLELMQRCWETDPGKRPSFSEIKVELVRLLQEIQGVEGTLNGS
nr:serine/threonine-protein kinase STY46-like [Tanacetum cinerariifolium]